MPNIVILDQVPILKITVGVLCENGYGEADYLNILGTYMKVNAASSRPFVSGPFFIILFGGCGTPCLPLRRWGQVRLMGNKAVRCLFTTHFRRLLISLFKDANAFSRCFARHHGALDVAGMYVNCSPPPKCFCHGGSYYLVNKTAGKTWLHRSVSPAPEQLYSCISYWCYQTHEQLVDIKLNSYKFVFSC